jgi:hypothetical protein
MLKGVLLAFGIMVALALVPLVNLVGVPFGPFVGGYFGIVQAGDQPGSAAARGIRFGLLLGALALAVASALALAATWALDLGGSWVLLAWLGVVVFTVHTGIMGALGAMYRLARRALKQQP